MKSKNIIPYLLAAALSLALSACANQDNNENVSSKSNETTPTAISATTAPEATAIPTSAASVLSEKEFAPTEEYVMAFPMDILTEASP